MIPIYQFIQQDINRNSHLELDFNKNSLNTTCSSKILSTQEERDFERKQPQLQLSNKSTNILNQTINIQSQNRQSCLNKNSHCFLKQISKVLKRNKLKCYQKQKDKKFCFAPDDKLNEALNISEIHFKTKITCKESKTNQQIKRIIKKDQIIKQNFNFQEFLQHWGNKVGERINKSESVNLLKKGIIQYKMQIKQRKIKPMKKKTLEQKIAQSIQPKKQNDFIQNKGVQKDPSKQVNMSEQIIYHNQFNQDQTFIIYQNQNSKQSRFHPYKQSQKLNYSKLTNSRKQSSLKSFSRALSVKQIRAQQINRQNQKQNASLQKSLKTAMLNLQIKQCLIQPTGRIKIYSEKPQTLKDKKLITKQLNQTNRKTLTMQQIHFDKLKERVKSKMDDFRKIKQIRDSQDKQKHKRKKNRIYSTQQKSVPLTIEGTNMTLRKNQLTKNNFKDKQFQNRRPFTSISRTGLQYDRRQSYRRRSSDRQHRMINLAGVNNSANHFRTFSKNSRKQIDQLEECKSDRVVRTLRQKYSRPQTAKVNVPCTSRPSTAKYNKNRNSEIRSPRNYQGIEYEKITKKQIDKQKIKQKLFGLLIECDEQKECNKDIMQGLSIFEDYCDNVDKGLKDITEQINQYMKNQ